MRVINLKEKCRLVNKTWSPAVVAEMNDYQFKVVKLEGEFVWHCHHETDETFLVIDGVMDLELENESFKVNAGEMIVVPKGLLHRTRSEKPCEVLVIEPRGVVNTGSAPGNLTADMDVWV